MRDCRGELLDRVRRGLASAQEQTAFDAHLAGCESCQMTFDLMSDFDAVGEAEPGDWERVAAMAGTAVAMHGRSVPVARGSGHRAWRFAVAALVLSSAAAAGVAVRLGTQATPSSSEASAPSEELPHVQETPTIKKREPEEAEPSPPEAPVSPEEESIVERAAAPSDAAPGRAVVQLSAKDIYRSANEARRLGKSSVAVSLYQKLQRNYPGAPESHASRVSLGGLLLRAGSAKGALVQFDAYLATSGGQLAAEALFGRAQALRALGRLAEEAQNLERLVASYPQSAYATHAKRRLTELR